MEEEYNEQIANPVSYTEENIRHLSDMEQLTQWIVPLP